MHLKKKIFQLTLHIWWRGRNGPRERPTHTHFICKKYKIHIKYF